MTQQTTPGRTTDALSGLVLGLLGLFWVGTVLSCGGLVSVLLIAYGADAESLGHIAAGFAGAMMTATVACAPIILIWKKVQG